MMFDLIRLEVWAFIGSAAGIVLFKLLTGRINMAGLLGNGDAAITTYRVQMLVTTIYVAFAYLQLVAAPNATGLPDVPQNLLLLLGGSHAVYLGGKGVDRLGWMSALSGLNQ